MQGSAQANKDQVSKLSKEYCLNDTQMQSSSLTLPVLSTLNEKDCKPFWNQQCSELQSILWLPQKTASQDQDSNSSSGLLNYQVDESKFWMTRITPVNPSIQPSLSVSLPAFATATMGKDPHNVIGSKRIRFYPENEQAYFDALALYRRSYNLAVERFINDDYRDDNGKYINMRPEIKAQVKEEQEKDGRAYNSIISDNGTLDAATTFKAVCVRNKNRKGEIGGFSQINFKSRKGSKHSFSIDRLPVGLSPCVKALGKIHLTESIPPEAINKSCIITYDKGRWFIQVQQHIKINTEIQGKVNCVAIDPGVRTFATCFSQTEVWTVGDNFTKDKLFPLMKDVDTLISRKKKILNTQGGVKFIEMPQWARDQIVYCDNAINRLKCKKDDLILDLHNRLAFELVRKYDVIFLPTFETKSMVRRKDKKVRTLRRNTCRQMLDLNHYGFKTRVKWYAKKYGKHVADCNESYTSKTRSWNGEIDDKLGGKKIIKGDGFTVGRDINAARGILLKSLTMVA
jgi:putative transposase